MNTTNIPLMDLRAGTNARSFTTPSKALIRSVKEIGFINPITVIEADKYQGRQTYTIVAGHRRFETAKHLGLPTIPSQILNGKTKDGDVELIALAENHARKDLSDMEYAEAFALQNNRTDKEIAHIFGVTPTFVKQRRALASLHPRAKALIVNRDFPMDVAERLTILTHEQQLAWTKDVASTKDKHTWTVLNDLDEIVTDSSELNTSNVIFPKSQYKGEYTTDLFSQEKALQVFADQSQATHLQAQAILKTCTKLEDAGWTFAVPVKRSDWYEHYKTTKHTALCDDVTLKQLLNKELPDKIKWTKIPPDERGVVCVLLSPANLRWSPFMKQKPNTTASTALDANGEIESKKKRPDWGPTAETAIAAHKADLVRNKLSELDVGKYHHNEEMKIFMAIIVCGLGDISIRKEPTQWNDKVKERTTAAAWTDAQTRPPTDFAEVLKDPKLAEYFRNLITKAMFEFTPYSYGQFQTLRPLANHLGINFQDEWIPTKQVLNSLTKEKLVKLAKKLKFTCPGLNLYSDTAIAKKTKKTVLEAVHSHMVKHNVTWSPTDFYFEKKTPVKKNVG